MRARIAQFVVGALVIAAAALIPAAVLGGRDALVATSAALGLTALPALATMVAAGLTFRAAPDMLLLAGLGGSAVRLFLGLGGGLLLMLYDRATFGPAFLLGLAVLYLLFLALEIVLLVRERPTDHQRTT